MKLNDHLWLLRRVPRLVQGRDLLVRPSTHARTESIVSAAATWTLALDHLQTGGIAYCFGVGTDLGLEIALATRFGMRVHAFDPTPRSGDWIRKQHLPETLVFHPIGLAASDGVLRFEEPEDSQHVSFSAAKASGRPTICLPVQRLPSIVTNLRHPSIDLLKMDIEGSEYEVIRDMSTHSIRPKQVLVEFHHRFTNFAPADTRAALATMRTLGYEIAHVSPNGEEFLFLLSRELAAQAH